MEIEEMKTLWGQLSDKIEKQENLTDKIIIDMTQEKYKNRFSKLSSYEIAGTVVCYLAAFWLIVNFGKLDTWYLRAGGMFALGCLLMLPALVLNALHKIQRIKIADKSYKETLLEYAKAKRHLLTLQKVSIYINSLFVVVILPVGMKILHNRDLLMEGNMWFWYIPIMVIFLIFFSRWVYKHYVNVTNSAENLLKEL